MNGPLRSVKGGQVLFLAAVLVVGLSFPALAQEELDFSIPALQPLSSVISYAGGAAPLTGTVKISNVTGIDTPLNSGVFFDCIGKAGCTLKFTSGPNDGPWSWGAGGSITITGAIDADKDHDTTPDANDIGFTTLLSGVISSATVDGVGRLHVAFPLFTDNKSTALLALFGLPNTTFTGSANVGFQTKNIVKLGSAFKSSKVTSGDLVNIVPESGSLLLLGSVMIALGCASRKRIRA